MIIFYEKKEKDKRNQTLYSHLSVIKGKKEREIIFKIKNLLKRLL
jgi:hypothetical protein